MLLLWVLEKQYNSLGNGKDEKQGQGGDSDNCTTMIQSPRQVGYKLRCYQPGPARGPEITRSDRGK